MRGREGGRAGEAGQLHLLCAGLIEEEGGAGVGLFDRSLFSPFPIYFPSLYDKKTDFVPLRLLSWCFNGLNTGIHLLRPRDYRSCPDVTAKGGLETKDDADGW